MCPADDDSDQPAHPYNLISLQNPHKETAHLAIQNVPSEDSKQIALWAC